MSMQVSKGAELPEAYLAPALLYRSAREGLEDLLRQPMLFGVARPAVLLPSFIGWSPNEGSGVFDPITNLRLPFGFYRLERDLAVDVEALEEALSTGRYQVLVVIHYFGRTERNLVAIRALADRHQVVLIEDLAHGFFTAQMGGAAGQVGSVGVYSLHKMFAMPARQGGMLRYRDRGLLDGQRETAPELARLVLDYDWVGIARARRRHFCELTRRLAKLPGCGRSFELLWPELAPFDVPQSLPVRIIRGDRNAVYHSMNSGGVGMVSLYHTLVDALASFSEMMELASTIINFPVHQDVDVNAYDGIVAAFEASLGAATR
jgi:hypothetical protein